LADVYVKVSMGYKQSHMPETQQRKWVTMSGALVLGAPVALAFWIRHLVQHDPYLFVSLMGERGLFEILQTAILDITLAGAVILAWFEWRRRDRALAILHAFFALFVFLVLMEEVNWGQRFFEIETPVALRASNRQGEMNLHNLRSVNDWQSAVTLLMSLYGVLSPVVWIVPARRRRQWPLAIAAQPLALTWFLPMLVYDLTPWLQRLTGWPPTDTFATRKLHSMMQEPIEAAFYVAFLIMVAAWLQLARPRRPDPGTTDSLQ
jgi:hypothetical protein